MVYAPQNLRLLRKKYGLTQKEMADILEVSRAAYSSYENGYANMPFKVLKTLTNILGINSDQFLTDDINNYHLPKNIGINAQEPGVSYGIPQEDLSKLINEVEGFLDTLRRIDRANKGLKE